MVGYIVRFWRGGVTPWLSLLLAMIAYVVVSLGGIWITSMFNGPVISAIMLVLWFAVVALGFMGTLRSAIAALRQWRAAKARAVGGVVALAALATFIVFAVLDFYQL